MTGPQRNKRAAARTTTSERAGLEDKALHLTEDKTAGGDSEPRITGDSPEPNVAVQFSYHHGDAQPGDVREVPVRDAATLVAEHRATYFTG